MSLLLSHFFSHLNNSQQNRILVIQHPSSKLLLSLLHIFHVSGYIRGFRLVPSLLPRPPLSSSPLSPRVEILLKYKNQKPAIRKVIQISKPSKRVYFSVKDLSFLPSFSPAASSSLPVSLPVSSSLFFMKGVFILSTSRGIMTHWTAYRLNLGGEVLCHVS